MSTGDLRTDRPLLYATEGARAVLTGAFGELGLEEVVSFTVPENLRSRRVMEKIGMTHDPADDFDHPAATGASRRHVLYRMARLRSSGHVSEYQDPR